MGFQYPRGISGRSWTLRIGAAALTGLALILSACGAGNASTQPTGTVSIGHLGTLIPGEFKWGEDSTGGMPYIAPRDSNNPNADYYGYEVDIAMAMAKLMNVQEVPTQVVYSNWPQGLSTQQYDFFMNGLEIAPENAKSATFSIPYYVYTQSIVVLTSNTTIHTFDDLAGKTVETGTAYKAQFIMEAYNASHSTKINIKTTDNPTPFDDLTAGRVDAMFIDTPIAKWYGANDPSGKFKTVGGDLDPGYYGIGFSRTNPNTPVLKSEINQAIAELWRNGTLEKIYKTGGAYNSGANNQPVLQKYDMWTDSEPCLGNFLPTNPTHVAGCPTPATS
jgi:polar amino acid transport system substrate-binding protein